jgi:small-conductance mechanosensitive channel
VAGAGIVLVPAALRILHGLRQHHDVPYVNGAAVRELTAQLARAQNAGGFAADPLAAPPPIPYRNTVMAALEGPLQVTVAVLAARKVVLLSGAGRWAHAAVVGHSNNCLMESLRAVPLALCAALLWFALRAIDGTLREARARALGGGDSGAQELGAQAQAVFDRSRTVGRAAAALLVSVITIEAAGLPFKSLYASLGFVTFALGLASQETAKNVLGGFVLRLYRPFVQGDLVEVAHIHGHVLDVGWLQTCFRGHGREVLYVPNGHFVSQTIVNLTRASHRRLQFSFSMELPDLAAGGGRGLEKVTSSIREALKAHPEVDSRECAPRASLAGVTLAGVEVRVEVVVRRRPPAQLAELRESLLLLIFECCAREGARIPTGGLAVAGDGGVGALWG